MPGILGQLKYVDFVLGFCLFLFFHLWIEIEKDIINVDDCLNEC